MFHLLADKNIVNFVIELDGTTFFYFATLPKKSRRGCGTRENVNRIKTIVNDMSMTVNDISTLFLKKQSLCLEKKVIPKYHNFFLKSRKTILSL
jgi:hypothetical protein